MKTKGLTIFIAFLAMLALPSLASAQQDFCGYNTGYNYNCYAGLYYDSGTQLLEGYVQVVDNINCGISEATLWLYGPDGLKGVRYAEGSDGASAEADITWWPNGENGYWYIHGEIDANDDGDWWDPGYPCADTYVE